MAYETVADIVTDAAQLLGLQTGAISNPFASTDQNIQQLLALLKSAGRALVAEHQWSQLEAEHTFSTVAGQDSYAMPADFDRHVDQTQWNRDSQLQLAGPLGAQGWQALKTLNTASSVQFYFRTQGPTLLLHPEPSDVQDLALEYVSRYWVKSAASSVRDKDKPTVATDVLFYDSRLLVARLRMDWLRAKQFDSTAATAEYLDMLAAAKNASRAAPVLDIAGTLRGPRMIGWENLPPTGWGT